MLNLKGVSSQERAIINQAFTKAILFQTALWSFVVVLLFITLSIYHHFVNDSTFEQLLSMESIELFLIDDNILIILLIIIAYTTNLEKTRIVFKQVIKVINNAIITNNFEGVEPYISLLIEIYYYDKATYNQEEIAKILADIKLQLEKSEADTKQILALMEYKIRDKDTQENAQLMDKLTANYGELKKKY